MSSAIVANSSETAELAAAGKSKLAGKPSDGIVLVEDDEVPAADFRPKRTLSRERNRIVKALKSLNAQMSRHETTDMKSSASATHV